MKTQVASVQFHNHTLTVITHNNQQLVAMRPVCEGIGLAWGSQRNRIMRDEVLGSTVFMMNTVAEDNKQRELLCLPLEYLNGWLFGIDVSRCREEIRPALIQYKRECYQVLANYWQQGEAVNHRAQKTLRTPLTIEQQSIIKDLVKSRVETLPPSKQAKAAITCWSALKSKFGCSYKEIESDQFSDAVSLVARITLEGEFLGKEEPNGVMTEDDLYKVYLLSNHMNHLYDIFNKYNMYESLKALGSRAGIEMIDHILDGNRHANQLVKTYAQALDDYQRKLRINHYSCVGQ
ncbi:putative phage antirepressor N-terminal domain containing protein [Bacillus phage vB_BspP_Dartukuta]|nr:putative phage antirepressor N-terminal domain containing protein [Bacillus phage vB_BspP_Dartukuta]